MPDESTYPEIMHGILGLPTQLDDALIESVLANNLISVDGESTLSDRVSAYVADAQTWLRQELLDDYDPLLMTQETATLAVRCVVMKAVVSAIPSLDLVVTPTGFGVVSSSSLAPASKERVERLIESLSAALDGCLASLFDLLARDPLWKEKELPSAMCSSFFRLRDALHQKSEGDVFSAYRALRDASREVVGLLESQYLGSRLIRSLLLEYWNPYSDVLQLVYPIRMAAMRYYRALRRRPSMLPDGQDVWHTAQSVLTRLSDFPEFYEEWWSEMGHTVHTHPVDLKRPGAYSF